MTQPPNIPDADTEFMPAEVTNFQFVLGTTPDGQVKIDMYTVIGRLQFAMPPEMARGIGEGLRAEADLAEMKLGKIYIPDWNAPATQNLVCGRVYPRDAIELYCQECSNLVMDHELRD